MNDYRAVALIAIVVGVALAAAFSIGRNTASAPAAATPASVEPTRLAAAGGHPPVVAQAGNAQGGNADAAREGKVSFDNSLKFVHFRVGNKNVKRILVDREHVWVGTSGGVVRYNTKNDEFKLFDVKSGLLSNGIFHVGKLRDRVVLGTYGGGMSLFDAREEKWETFNIPEGLGDAFVYDVLETKSGDVWIATWSGVNRIKGGDLRDRSKWELYTVENTKGGLPNDWVYGLAEGRDGVVWLATEGGLAKFANGRWENWNHAKGLGADYEAVKGDIQFRSDPSKYSQHHAKQKEEMGLAKVDVAYNPNYVVALTVDRDGVVWAGTWGGGLARYDGKSWRNFTTADGLPGNHVFMLHSDPQGQLWIGTNNGLANLRDGKFDVMTTADGLFANAVFSMATGADGSLWVGSYGGVARIRRGAPRS